MYIARAHAQADVLVAITTICKDSELHRSVVNHCSSGYLVVRGSLAVEVRGRRSGGQTLAAARRRCRRTSQAALGLPAAADRRRFGHSSSSVAAM